MKKSLGVFVKFEDGHEEKYEGAEWCTWDIERGVVFIGRNVVSTETIEEHKTKMFSRKVTTTNKTHTKTVEEDMAQFKIEHVFGIIDFYEEE